MRISSGTFTIPSHMPRPDLFDSDVVVLALVTAQALEAEGEIREAARWLRRAADQARKEGNDKRVLVLAHAAAELANRVCPAPLPASSSSSRLPARASSPRTTARTSSRRTTMPRLSSSSAISALARVANPSSVRDESAFVGRALEAREPQPESTMEAMLMLMAAVG